jgi:hypothetical protein
VAVKHLFPEHQIKFNVRREAGMARPATNNPNITAYWELDVWVPSLNIGFEFQDAHHYVDIWYSQIPVHMIQQHDTQKREAMEKLGRTLIVVPCWWDKSVER